MKVLLVCDKSGGHIFPALAAAKVLRDHGQDVRFFAASRFFRDLLKKEGFKVYGRDVNMRNILVEGLLRIPEALGLLLKLWPRRVVGFGGRDSFFIVVFARLLFMDTEIYEPNRKMGKANTVLAWFVRRILRGWPESIGMTAGSKDSFAGVPLREAIINDRRDKARAKKSLGFGSGPVILCLGGSQGASFVNRVFLEFLEKGLVECQVIHLTGTREYIEISQRYIKINIKSVVLGFHQKMEELYGAADMVISRSGATVLAEIAYYGLPQVLIPHPGGGGHQRGNAFYFRDKKTAEVFLQEGFSSQDFDRVVRKIISDDVVRRDMAAGFEGITMGVSAVQFCKNAGWISG